jgi:hypothetical protein
MFWASSITELYSLRRVAYRTERFISKRNDVFLTSHISVAILNLESTSFNCTFGNGVCGWQLDRQTRPGFHTGKQDKIVLGCQIYSYFNQLL